MLLLYHGIKGEYGILNFCMFPYSGIFFFLKSNNGTSNHTLAWKTDCNAKNLNKNVYENKLY